MLAFPLELLPFLLRSLFPRWVAAPPRRRYCKEGRRGCLISGLLVHSRVKDRGLYLLPPPSFLLFAGLPPMPFSRSEIGMGRTADPSLRNGRRARRFDHEISPLKKPLSVVDFPKKVAFSIPLRPPLPPGQFAKANWSFFPLFQPRIASPRQRRNGCKEREGNFFHQGFFLPAAAGVKTSGLRKKSL